VEGCPDRSRQGSALIKSTGPKIYTKMLKSKWKTLRKISPKSSTYHWVHNHHSFPLIIVILFVTCTENFNNARFWKLTNITRIFLSFSWGTFSHVTCLVQSRSSENIWWIIINNYSQKWREISTTFTDTEVNNCFSIYHTSWITSGLNSNFTWLRLILFETGSHFVFLRLLGGE